MADEDWTRRKELASLLQACRSRLARPAVPGRRRGAMGQAEVADLADISSRHYGRLERGERTPPPELVDKVAAALKMSDAERSAFHVLATGQDPPRKVTDPETKPQRTPDRALRELVMQATQPAAVTDETWTFSLYNESMNKMSGGWFDAAIPEDRNLICYLFSPHAEGVLPRIHSLRRFSISTWRYQLARNITSARFHDVVARLTAASTEAAALWDQHEIDFPPHLYEVSVRDPGRGIIQAPVVFTPVTPYQWLFSLVLPANGEPAPAQPPALRPRQAALPALPSAVEAQQNLRTPRCR